MTQLCVCQKCYSVIWYIPIHIYHISQTRFSSSVHSSCSNMVNIFIVINKQERLMDPCWVSHTHAYVGQSFGGKHFAVRWNVRQSACLRRNCAVAQTYSRLRVDVWSTYTIFQDAKHFPIFSISNGVWQRAALTVFVLSNIRGRCSAQSFQSVAIVR